MSSFFYTQSCSNRSLCFKKVQHLRCYQTFSVISIHWDVRSFKVWHLYWFPKDMKTDYQQFLKTLSLLKKKESFGHIRCGHPDNFHTYAEVHCSDGVSITSYEWKSLHLHPIQDHCHSFHPGMYEYWWTS